MVLKVSGIVPTQVRQEKSSLSSRETVLFLVEHMTYLCVYCLLREKENTKTSAEELHAEVPFLHSFVGWQLTSVAVRIINKKNHAACLYPVNSQVS